MTGDRLASSQALVDREHAQRSLTARIVVGAALLAFLLGSLAAVSPLYPLALLMVGAAFVAVYRRPQMAAYLYLFLAPLATGIKRGALVPLLRPNEVLVGLFISALLLRWMVRWLRGEPPVITISRFDITLLVVVVLGSVFSLGWEAARAFTPNSDDVLHALVFWKYFALYLMIRTSVRTKEQVLRCVWIILVANGIVAVIAILQSMQIGGVDTLMARLYPPTGEYRTLGARGTATIAHSIAVGDIMSMSLALAMGLFIYRQGRRGVALALAALFTIGGVASGQFSGFIALVVGFVAVGVATRKLLQVALAGLPALMMATLLLTPVVSQRLGGFAGGTLPQSWSGRWENLTEIVWPQLFRDWTWIFGVRASPRIPAWETWRDWVYIESGHTWMLWVGGIPLLLAFLYFCFVALRASYRVASRRTDIVGVAAIGAFAGASIVTVLSLLDPHLTVRGTADLWFPLLAIAFTSIPMSSGASPPDAATRQPSLGSATNAASQHR